MSKKKSNGAGRGSKTPKISPEKMARFEKVETERRIEAAKNKGRAKKAAPSLKESSAKTASKKLGIKAGPLASASKALATTKKRDTTADYVVRDEWFLKAKKLGFRARSAFKLLEIQEKFDLIQPSMKVLDVASAPGSFLQVISRIIGSEGKLIGVDIQRIVPLGKPNVRVIQESIFEKEKLTERFHEFGITQFDLITSDIAPATTGMTGVDQYRSIELNIAIMEVADTFLAQNGNLVLKVFVGEDVDELVRAIKARYHTLKRIKPAACRDRSFEEYFICLGKK